MKWLILSCFLMWARHGEGGALKCLPGDDACSTQLLKEVEQQEMEIRRPSGLSDAPAECLSSSEWESNCHSCRCVDGEAQCVRQAGCDSIEEPIRCKPNTTFERECNMCRCLQNGLGICTIKECRDQTAAAEAPPSKPIVPKGVDCAPGTTWQSQCNECVCSPDGYRHCTEKACPGQETEPLLRCAPQSQWKNDCNMCWCNSGRAMCTKMGCMAIPSDMHFDDRKGDLETAEVPEPNNQDVNSNDILKSDLKDQKHLSENLEDLDTTTDAADDNLTEDEFKNLEDLDHNDIDTPIQIPDQDMKDFAANTDSNALDNDLELLKTLSSQENKKDLEDDKVNRDVEILDETYFNQNSQSDHRVKRSACKPNEEFQNDCNTCKCSESGQSYSCSQNECMGGGNNDEGKKDVDKEVEVFMENEGVDHIQRHSVCKASTTFYVGCNPCHCNSDGTDYSCTNKLCPLPEDVEVFHELHKSPYVGVNAPKSAKNATKKVCVENRMFIMNCNTCWCNEDGTSYFCTRKVCVPGENEPTVAENNEALKTTKNATKKVCVENRMFIMNCNTCWCNEDGTSYSCTRKVCVPGENEPTIAENNEQNLRIVKQECKPGEVFEVDCNMCRCNPDGKSYSCTRRACFDDETKNKTLIRKTRAPPQEAQKTKNCQPRQEFRMDCNTCLCDDYGENFSCTRIDCVALNNNNNHNNNGNGNRRKRDVSQKVPSECVPGSVFDQGCNVCRCTEDGGHATCTLKRCHSVENSTMPATESSGSSFRCNPGEQFKRGCNHCTCSADGKSVFCTLLVCDDDLSPK